jgi:hypothetical protein
MRRLLVTLLLLAAVVVGVGIYLDWFRFSTGGTGDSGKTTVDLTIDKDKMKADAEAAKEKAKSVGSQAKGGAARAAESGSPPR